MKTIFYHLNNSIANFGGRVNSRSRNFAGNLPFYSILNKAQAIPLQDTEEQCGKIVPIHTEKC